MPKARLVVPRRVAEGVRASDRPSHHEDGMGRFSRGLHDRRAMLSPVAPDALGELATAKKPLLART